MHRMQVKNLMLNPMFTLLNIWKFLLNLHNLVLLVQFYDDFSSFQHLLINRKYSQHLITYFKDGNSTENSSSNQKKSKTQSKIII